MDPEDDAAEMQLPRPTQNAPQGLPPSPGLTPPAGLDAPVLRTPIHPGNPDIEPSPGLAPPEAQEPDAPATGAAGDFRAPAEEFSAPADHFDPPAQEFHAAAERFDAPVQEFQPPASLPGVEASRPPTSTSNASRTQRPSEPTSRVDGPRISRGAIVGIVAGAVLLLLVLVFAALATGASASTATQQPRSSAALDERNEHGVSVMPMRPELHAERVS